MSEDRKPGRELPSEIKLDYIKAPTFRDIFVDGVFGGVTPRGYIQMAVYNERFSIPQTAVLELNPDGTAGEEILEKRVSRSDVVRDVEANLIMDAELARSVAAWLIEKAEVIEQAQQQRAGKSEPDKKVN